MRKIVKAPFTDNQVSNINDFQKSGFMHEFTCGNHHDGEKTLIAVNDGLICPTCDYTQNWVHSHMADFKSDENNFMNTLKMKAYNKEKIVSIEVVEYDKPLLHFTYFSKPLKIFGLTIIKKGFYGSGGWFGLDFISKDLPNEFQIKNSFVHIKPHVCIEYENGDISEHYFDTLVEAQSFYKTIKPKNSIQS